MGETGTGDLARAMAKILSADRVARDVPMRLHTSFRIGGPADFLVTVESPAELAAVLDLCRRLAVPSLILGRGTNLLVRDGGIRGVILRLAGEFLQTAFDGDGRRVIAGAAVGLGDLSRECGRRGLAGLEFAEGIPGSVGGAVVMNAGAYDGEMKDVLEAAGVLRPGLDQVDEVAAADLGFRYRGSRLQDEGWTVAWARFLLAPGDPAAIRRRQDEYAARRKSRQPLDLPSAGSVFKRPPGRFAGPLIQESGCQGLRVGDAQVSEVHAGFIVNLGSATARDVLALIDEVRSRVLARTGVTLEPEIRIIGMDPASD